MRILVVEDDEETSAYIALGLREEGHCVDCLTDGRSMAGAGSSTAGAGAAPARASGNDSVRKLKSAGGGAAGPALRGAALRALTPRVV